MPLGDEFLIGMNFVSGELKKEFGKSSAEARFVPFVEQPSLCMRVLKYHPDRHILDLNEFMADGSLIDMR